MAAHDIIVIGASAGGVTSIQRLLSLLPSDLPAAIFDVLHRLAVRRTDDLADVLAVRASLPARAAVDGERFHHGKVYVAPRDAHLLVERGVIRLERSPKESYSRPSVDVLFRSAALSYGRRVVGVLLTGILSEGTVGLWQIRKHGGITIAQDPAEAEFDDMPRSAIANVPVDCCLQIAAIGRTLVELATGQPSARSVHRELNGDDLKVVLHPVASFLEQGFLPATAGSAVVVFRPLRARLCARSLAASRSPA
jgi:two-component system chemotaxis response regulator CheB